MSSVGPISDLTDRADEVRSQGEPDSSRKRRERPLAEVLICDIGAAVFSTGRFNPSDGPGTD